MTISETLKEVIKTLDSKKAKDITALNVSNLSSLGEYFVIASGSSSTQVRSLADDVVAKLREKGRELNYPQQGDSKAQWVLLDYGDIMVHIFHETTREFYALEKLWGDAEEINIDKFLD